MKKILCLFLILFTFGLAGCSNSKQKKNAEIDEESLNFILMRAMGFAPRFYSDEKTFKTDPNDNNYEIGYAYELNIYDSTVEVDEEEIAIFSADHFRVRRNKETMDEDWIDDEDDKSGNTYQIKYIPVDLDKETTKGFYKITYTGYDQWGNFDRNTAKIEKITKKQAMDYIGIEVWEIPNSEIKVEIIRDEDGETKSFDTKVKLKGDKENAVFNRTYSVETGKDVSYAVRVKNCFDDKSKVYTGLVLERNFYKKIIEELKK